MAQSDARGGADELGALLRKVLEVEIGFESLAEWEGCSKPRRSTWPPSCFACTQSRIITKPSSGRSFRWLESMAGQRFLKANQFASASTVRASGISRRTFSGWRRLPMIYTARLSKSSLGTALMFSSRRASPRDSSPESRPYVAPSRRTSKWWSSFSKRIEGIRFVSSMIGLRRDTMCSRRDFGPDFTPKEYWRRACRWSYLSLKHHLCRIERLVSLRDKLRHHQAIQGGSLMTVISSQVLDVQTQYSLSHHK